jgi:hypothetical protein
MNLLVAFYGLPHGGGVLIPADEQEFKKMKLARSHAFLKALGRAQQFLNRRSLLVPKDIVDATRNLLGIAHRESWDVQLYPESEGSPLNPLPSHFLKERKERLASFQEGADKLEMMMRGYIDKKSSPTSSE